jgi:hypothetical protein
VLLVQDFVLIDPIGVDYEHAGRRVQPGDTVSQDIVIPVCVSQSAGDMQGVVMDCDKKY